MSRSAKTQSKDLYTGSSPTVDSSSLETDQAHRSEELSKGPKTSPNSFIHNKRTLSGNIVPFSRKEDASNGVVSHSPSSQNFNNLETAASVLKHHGQDLKVDELAEDQFIISNSAQDERTPSGSSPQLWRRLPLAGTAIEPPWRADIQKPSSPRRSPASPSLRTFEYSRNSPRLFDRLHSSSPSNAFSIDNGTPGSPSYMNSPNRRTFLPPEQTPTETGLSDSQSVLSPVAQHLSPGSSLALEFNEPIPPNISQSFDTAYPSGVGHSSPQSPLHPLFSVVPVSTNSMDESTQESTLAPARQLPALRISVPAPSADTDNDTVMVDHESARIEEQQEEMFLDDEGLTPLEKIYLFSRSTAPVHRMYIAKQLPFLIQAVPPNEAIDFVVPLLNSLGTDEDEGVKEVFVLELVPVMWWFFTHCKVTDREVPSLLTDEGVPYLASNAFTPLIGSLLLSANPRVGDSARLAVVDLLNNLQATELQQLDERYVPILSNDVFGDTEKNIIVNEIMYGVVLGMARLDLEFHEDGEEHMVGDTDDGSVHELPKRSAAPSPEEGMTERKEMHETSDDDDEPFLYRPLSRPASFSDGIEEVDIVDPDDIEPNKSAQTTGYFPPVEPIRSTDSHIDSDGWVTAPPPTPPNIVNQVPTEMSSTGDPQHDQGNWMNGMLEEEPSINDASEEATVGRVASMSVVAAIAANAQMPETMQRLFVEEVQRVGEDPVDWVRREASFAIGALAKVVPLELVVLSLLPLYEQLVKDRSSHVRHSIIFALPAILARVDPVRRRALTVPSLNELSRDSAGAVRSGLLEVLGEVIYTFNEDPGGPPQELLDLFIAKEADWEPQLSGMDFYDSFLASPLASTFNSTPPSSNYYDPSNHAWFRDSERPIVCAFNFPAVALTLGASRWQEIRSYYLHLAQNHASKVRRTISASLGEVAAIIGPEAAADDLIPIFWESLRSEDEEIRAKILECLGKFIESIPIAQRELVMDELQISWNGVLRSWREREAVSRLIGQLVHLVPSRHNVCNEIMRLALRDNVAAVREAAISSLPVFLDGLSSEELRQILHSDLISLAQADTYRRRSTFVACVLSLLQTSNAQTGPDRFNLWDPIEALASDSVVDVRINVSRLIALLCERFYPEPTSRPQNIITLIFRLSEDSSPQVRAFVSFLLEGTPVAPDATKTPNYGERSMFAAFSRPPHGAVKALEGTFDDEVDKITTKIAEKMDIDVDEHEGDSPMDPLTSNSSVESGQVTTGVDSTISTSLPPRPDSFFTELDVQTAANIAAEDHSTEDDDHTPKSSNRYNIDIDLPPLPDTPDGTNTGSFAPSSPVLSRHTTDTSSVSDSTDTSMLIPRGSLHRLSSDPAVTVASC